MFFSPFAIPYYNTDRIQFNRNEEQLNSALIPMQENTCCFGDWWFPLLVSLDVSEGLIVRCPFC